MNNLKIIVNIDSLVSYCELKGHGLMSFRHDARKNGLTKMLTLLIKYKQVEDDYKSQVYNII